MMTARPRVLVADDHEECRWAIASLLGAEFEVVATVADGRKLIEAAVSLLPDVIVSDISMPLLTGTQAMQELHREGYRIPFVLISTVNSGVEDYIKQGATAFVNKLDLGHDLITAVFSAVLGAVCVQRDAKGNRSNTLTCA
jgi:CheY-like chemotaxis protein